MVTVHTAAMQRVGVSGGNEKVNLRARGLQLCGRAVRSHPVTEMRGAGANGVTKLTLWVAGTANSLKLVQAGVNASSILPSSL